MARSRRRSAARKLAANVNFSYSEQARAWFQNQPREVRFVLVVRSALRALPLIEAGRRHPDFAPRIALPALRACFVTRAIAEYPLRRDRLQSAATAAADAATNVASTANLDAVLTLALSAAEAAAVAARAAANAATTSASDLEISVLALTAAALAVREDAVAIEQGRAVTDIVAAPLWPGGVPQRIAAAWGDLLAWMLGDTINNWHPWVQWYERVRDGRFSFGEAFDLAVASLTDEQWNEEPVPAAVNRRIAALLAEHTGQAARPASEARAAREAEPQAERHSPKPDRRDNSSRAKRTARTTIGKALLERSEQVQLALVAVISLIEDKLQQLRANRPNHSETIDEWTNEISELEKLRQIVEGLQGDVRDYLTRAKAEKETVRSVKSFTDGVADFWTKNHIKILETGSNVGFFVTALAACSAMGAGGPITAAICGALAGGKPAIEALKAIRGRGSDSVRRVSGRRSL